MPDADWATTERKKAAVVDQKRRLEWTIHGSTKELQQLTQTSPVPVDKLLAALTLALAVTKELKTVAASAEELERF